MKALPSLGLALLAALAGSACSSSGASPTLSSGDASGTTGSTGSGGTSGTSGGSTSTSTGSTAGGDAATSSMTDGMAVIDAAAPGPAIPIVAGGNADAPYQLGANMFGISGSAFFAKAPFGSETVVLDKTQVGKICLKGNVDVVPTPADGGHPPYSSYWGIDLGFDLNDVIPGAAGAAPDANADANAPDANAAPDADADIDATAADASAGTDASTGADATANADAGSDATAAPMAVKSPWIVPANVLGFWFTVEGPTIPPLRLKVTPTGKDPAAEQDSCAQVSPKSGVPVAVPFTKMYVQCWDGPTGTGPNDISKGLVDVSIQVAADVSPPKPVDFCLTGIGVITE